jgi:hypothetical protein
MNGNGETSTLVVPVSYLVKIDDEPIDELQILDVVSKQYDDGLLTMEEAMRTMEGKQLWQQ